MRLQSLLGEAMNDERPNVVNETANRHRQDRQTPVVVVVAGARFYPYTRQLSSVYPYIHLIKYSRNKEGLCLTE